MAATRIKTPVQDGNVELLEQLLSVDKTGLNEKDFVRLTLESQFSCLISLSCQLGQTPLMYAVMAKNEQVVRVLIKYDVDQSIVNKV